ncbi:pyruvate:ferredoxin (flavodoxin) oxidoreductase [Anaeromicropila herbilytica]|uniref:Pyruvate:ferredoxin oxidoreductase n=1 Tax=Anaeromicropila herbilytica TaxID=2785025 RepID=A0A7R7EI17_9FIRM|nr:pyruvate-flavodoxin oxidoreductase [Anaeromicropila herbilytica]
MKQKQTMDGNQAAATAAYAFTEVASIYPITPSTTIAEVIEEWAAHGKKNVFDQEVKVIEMQSEAGAASTMRGALQAGVLASTYTASQGLLLMIPSLYKMSGELLPGVLHVTARTLATHALSIFGDHQDVMACRQTGVALLASSNVQEVMDFGVIAHLSAIKSRVPFIHFFDGFRTSHEYQKIEVVAMDDIKQMIDMKAVQEFRNRALNPEHPVVRGTTQNPDIYFQEREMSNNYYNAVPGIVEEYLKQFGKITGRNYKPYEYYGAKDATRLIIAMGSVCDTIEEVVDYLNDKGDQVGCLKVHLYRPFAESMFLEEIPKSIKKIAVLDRTKEPGAPGEPLYLDVLKAYKENKDITIVGGRYGLSSKDTTPSQILAVYNNLSLDTPKDRFTIGIVDDVTHTSLPEEDMVDTSPTGTISCKIWGLGSDGTVGSNKSAIKIIGDHSENEVQAYFSYDSKKSGGSTISHLRFGKERIRSPYLVSNANYIACHNKSFIYQHDVLKGIRKGGTFVLVCPWGKEELDEKLPAHLRKTLADKKILFYTIDALKIATEVGLGNRINMVMQSVFFKLADVIPFEKAVEYLKESIVKMYGKKGEDIVTKNQQAIDKAIDALVKVEVPESWSSATEDNNAEVKKVPDFVANIQMPMARHEGDELPVSAFANMVDGTFPLGTTAYEKRGIAPQLPQWQIEKCIQCNQCSYVCPHATIRPFLLNDEEYSRKPEEFETKQAVGQGLTNLQFRIQVAPLDCVGCGSCADVCPAKGKALIMQPAEEEIEKQAENWEYAMTVTAKDNIMSKWNVKGSQFVRPYLEFNGACPGCGETPYIRLLTQLFGDRMMISNATGCSSIWGASAPSIAYSTDANGKGPAWINPLFEDAAEFGLGLQIGSKQARNILIQSVTKALESDIDSSLKTVLGEWLDGVDDGELSKETSLKVMEALKKADTSSNQTLNNIMAYKDYLIKKSVWSIGGDGWAYDIGYGGLDHVISTGENIKIFVMDTEIYSNTGGQCSKSTQTASVAKLAMSGKKQVKKDLGLMAMSYGNVYVAQIAMGADMNQTIKAISEAESYKGPALIIAYAPCISHGIRTGMGTSIKEEKKAVEAGYWHLYRYNPALKQEGKNPFQLDSKAPSADYLEFIKGEIRFTQLGTTFPETADQLYEQSAKNAKERYDRYAKLAEQKVL